MLKRYYTVDNLPMKRPSGLCALALLVFVIGCSRAPSLNLLGSYFPSWMLCGVIGIFLTVAAKLFFLKIGFEQHLSPLILVYPCLTAFFMFSLWLLFFS